MTQLPYLFDGGASREIEVALTQILGLSRDALGVNFAMVTYEANTGVSGSQSRYTAPERPGTKSSNAARVFPSSPRVRFTMPVSFGPRLATLTWCQMCSSTRPVSTTGSPERARPVQQRGEAFRVAVKIATLDPFQGYKNAIDDELEDAVAVVDAFHVVKLGGQAVDEVRRRVQQETLGRRGHAGDPLYGIRTILRCGRERLTERQQARLGRAIAADERHDEVHIAWQAAQELRSAFHRKDLTEGRRIAEHVLASFPSCAIPEIARLGRTLRKWRDPFLAYFATAGASNGGTEAVIIWSPRGAVVHVADGRGRDAWATRSLEPVADVPHLAPVAG
jgi:hypothetical protein